MPLTYDTIKPGMHVKCNWKFSTSAGTSRYEKSAIIVRVTDIGSIILVWDDGYNGATGWSNPCYFDEITGGRKRKRKPKKIIPNIPMDTSLPILQAGYLQDRARKKFK